MRIARHVGHQGQGDNGIYIYIYLFLYFFVYLFIYLYMCIYIHTLTSSFCKAWHPVVRWTRDDM